MVEGRGRAWKGIDGRVEAHRQAQVLEAPLGFDVFSDVILVPQKLVCCGAEELAVEVDARAHLDPVKDELDPIGVL